MPGQAAGDFVIGEFLGDQVQYFQLRSLNGSMSTPWWLVGTSIGLVRQLLFNPLVDG